jgi:hypothetical protein
MHHAATSTDTEISANELRRLRIRLRDGNDAGLEQILDAYLAYLQSQLVSAKGDMNTGQVCEMLLEVASVVRDGKFRGRDAEFGGFINGLVTIYSNSFVDQESEGLRHTLGDYAELLETISREFPEHDYDPALQQLFLYMNRMFESEHKGWAEVLESIVSMPDTIGLVRLLKQECLPQIREWVEGGVKNLFQIRSDLTAMVRKLDMRRQLVEQEMARLEHSYREQHGEGNLIGLSQGRMARAMTLLRRKLVSIQQEMEDKGGLVDLVDSNIQEFQDLMASARRAFFMQLVPESRQRTGHSGQTWAGPKAAAAVTLQIVPS